MKSEKERRGLPIPTREIHTTDFGHPPANTKEQSEKVELDKLLKSMLDV